MAGTEHGLQRAIGEVFTALIIGAMIRAILPIYHLEWVIILVDIFSIIAIIAMIEKIKYWGIGYTIGWLVGLTIFISIIGPIQAVLYIIIALIMIIIKVVNKYKKWF